MGFSTRTCRPARSAAADRAWCASAGAATISASQPASRASNAIEGAPASQPTVFARSSSGSWIPASSARSDAATLSA